ncbi:hypothetical protein BDZ97DRAFT_206261 [Flammula alnicola]|nr:hypothetical protein BDZ97DRAFT_206261 [Flammula alnicola]
MAALIPPQNAAGVPLPPLPANPASLADIKNAKGYLDRLCASKLAASMGNPPPATDEEIGAAGAYTTAVISSHSPAYNGAPAYAADLIHNILQIQQDVTYMRHRSDELPVLLVNSHAVNRGRLLNPTAVANGCAPLLDVPNPRTREDLSYFTADQCAASAANLGLPALPAETPLLERRRQIAARIGVTLL